MKRLTIFYFTCVLALAAAGCTGDAGPMGPAGATGAAGVAGAAGADGAAGAAGADGADGTASIVAFGDVDYRPGPIPDTVLSFGPTPRVTGVSVDDSAGAGQTVVTVKGSFPASTGVLIVSTSSQQNVREEINTTGSIDSWTTSEIEFTVETIDTDTGLFSGEDFSFVLLGG